MVAWDAIGRVPPTHRLRIVGGRALYEDAAFNDETGRTHVRLARLDTDEFGLQQVNRYVDPDTPVELVRDDGYVEPDPFLLLLGA